MSALVIVGSARSDGDSARIAARLARRLGDRTRIIDLVAQSIEPFRYDCTKDRDDFRAIAAEIASHRVIILVTPVYWYTMSGVMKQFLDRLTDLLLDKDARPMGRSLAGRNLWVVATGTDETLPPGFDEPFARTARYFGMHWRRSIYVRAPADGAKP